MSREMFTSPLGVQFEFLTEEDADEAVLTIARYCASRGGVVAAEVVAKREKANEARRLAGCNRTEGTDWVSAYFEARPPKPTHIYPELFE